MVGDWVGVRRGDHVGTIEGDGDGKVESESGSSVPLLEFELRYLRIVSTMEEKNDSRWSDVCRLHDICFIWILISFDDACLSATTPITFFVPLVVSVSFTTTPSRQAPNRARRPRFDSDEAFWATMDGGRRCRRLNEGWKREGDDMQDPCFSLALTCWPMSIFNVFSMIRQPRGRCISENHVANRRGKLNT